MKTSSGDAAIGTAGPMGEGGDGDRMQISRHVVG